MIRIVFAALALTAIFEAKAMEEDNFNQEGPQQHLVPATPPIQLVEIAPGHPVSQPLALEDLLKAILNDTPIGNPGERFVITASQ